MCSIVPTARNAHNTRAYAKCCAELKLCEVEVPLVFLVTAAFSPPREGRYFEENESCDVQDDWMEVISDTTSVKSY